MRVLLSTIGTRGEVQPLVALATRLRELGQDVRLCAPPDFREWAERLGISFVPLGPELRSTAKPDSAMTKAMASPEGRRAMAEAMVVNQFETMPEAAEGCDVVVGGMALNIAAHSVAEWKGIPYFFTAYCPITLPSLHHRPPAFPGWAPKNPDAANPVLWADDAERWNEQWGGVLDARRKVLGLPPVDDVRGHVFTEEPWLAADSVLAPWRGPSALDVHQTGAWILPDHRPLSPELEAFLDAGEPPVYFGFGSIRAPEEIAKAMIGAARAHGRRVIVFRGWTGLSLIDDEPDCLAIGEVNQQALFPRVAAVVQHGGAGTTTAATRAGVPQVLVPRMFDQPYFAQRVRDLGIGTSITGEPSAESLTLALSEVLRPEVAERARQVGGEVRVDGADVAARSLMAAV
ncbi:glycosyltransferase [Amycolatopsis regifaucium]|uniref:Glycosyl transferase n=1 Tax=Amycolatopsis regifaucium TaxID=546365 RepID=A0A154MIP0_9PSEU|nr:glycosyltransferase [Amycolatopsis regifaucium]KZB83847.1 glycosyl transferase [Amycolatopsis regifaucium]OKA06711.1 glycosyl transferase [Amycolatopsis regifaucium]SFH24761.1 UDP:flavonoid glycosyltransferase YjiC, YdhE family [Amycolatopsis regifaucium]